jgi:site-specific DNA-methyltransferase (adenine-specific)
VPSDLCTAMITDPPYGISYTPSLKKHSDYKLIKNDDSLEAARFACFQSAKFSFSVIFGANCFPELLPHRGRWICWDKRLNAHNDKMLGNPFELAWMSKTSGYDLMIRKMNTNVVNPDKTKRFHPSQKPSGIFRQIINKYEKLCDVIFDPFMGSGSVLLAAKLEGKKAIGVEIQEEYCEGAAKRLEQGVLF